jgi:hypothetical protein
LFGAIGLVGLIGCSSGGSSGPATVPVKGTLTIDGQPANKVAISFAPLDSKLQGASGIVTNGSFELVTGNQGTRGAMVGKYKVVLSAVGSSDQAEAAKKYMAGGGKGPISKPISEEKKPFAEKYGSPTTSDKEVEVKPGSNDIKIDVPSK